MSNRQNCAVGKVYSWVKATIIIPTLLAEWNKPSFFRLLAKQFVIIISQLITKPNVYNSISTCSLCTFHYKYYYRIVRSRLKKCKIILYTQMKGSKWYNITNKPVALYKVGPISLNCCHVKLRILLLYDGIIPSYATLRVMYTRNFIYVNSCASFDNYPTGRSTHWDLWQSLSLHNFNVVIFHD